MEMNQRMSKRWWLLGVAVLVSIGLLVACGSNYNRSTDGLVLVGSQGSGLIETFGFNLNSGHVSPIANSPADTSSKVCVLGGLPSSIVVDPAGTYAYAIINGNQTLCGASSATGIQSFKLNSDGTVAAAGSQVAFTQETVIIPGVAPPNNTEAVSVVPSTMVMDSGGKFLFVADRATTDGAQPAGFVPGAVSVFAVSSGGSLTEVAGSPFFTTMPGTLTPGASLDIISLAVTPTVFPAGGINGVQNAVCSSAANPPTTEFLYAVDQLGNQVFEFQVDTTTGALGNPPNQTSAPSFSADQVPVGIAVDPCDRFVYVSNSLSEKVSAYTMCNGLATQSPTCPQIPDSRLVPVAGSPFAVSGLNGAGPMVVDPFGRYVYVLGTLSNNVAGLKISPVSGSLAALSPATVTAGLQPTSIAIRGDDNWMFITNFNAATVSQYSITPATGGLTAQQAIQTDNYPWGVAVK
jgi:6-phosphogluconolactonase (cycloisomerase 2 family)